MAKEEPSNAVTASSDAAWCVAPKEATVAAPVDSESNTITCANVTSVVPTACTTTAHLEGPKCNVPCEFSQCMHRLVTAVSSDDSVVEAVGSSLTDNPEVQEKRAPSIVHCPSSGASKNTHDASDKKCDDISSDGKNARHGNTVVHDGIISALNTSHDMPVENNDDITTVAFSKEPTKERVDRNVVDVLCWADPGVDEVDERAGRLLDPSGTNHWTKDGQACSLLRTKTVSPKNLNQQLIGSSNTQYVHHITHKLRWCLR